MKCISLLLFEFPKAVGHPLGRGGGSRSNSTAPRGSKCNADSNHPTLTAKGFRCINHLCTGRWIFGTFKSRLLTCRYVPYSRVGEGVRGSSFHLLVEFHPGCFWEYGHGSVAVKGTLVLLLCIPGDEVFV